MQYSIPRVVIAATQSGSGKTTIVTGLLAALRARGVQGFLLQDDVGAILEHQLNVPLRPIHGTRKVHQFVAS